MHNIVRQKLKKKKKTQQPEIRKYQIIQSQDNYEDNSDVLDSRWHEMKKHSIIIKEEILINIKDVSEVWESLQITQN